VTPDEKMAMADGDYFGAKWMEEQKEKERRERKERERREKEKRRKRKKAEVYVRLPLVSVPGTLFTRAPSLIDHPACRCDIAAAGVHFEAGACDDDVWRPVPSACRTDPEYSACVGAGAELYVSTGCDVDQL
jgi:hypothetical protein